MTTATGSWLGQTLSEGRYQIKSALDAGGMGERKAKFEPYSGDFIHVPPPYCYRCPFGLSYPSCGMACVKARQRHSKRRVWL